jgi:hypothetical protein
MEIVSARSLFLTLKKPLKLTVIYLGEGQKLKHYSLLMLARRTNITDEKIVLRY